MNSDTTVYKLAASAAADRLRAYPSRAQACGVERVSSYCFLPSSALLRRVGKQGRKATGGDVVHVYEARLHGPYGAPSYVVLRPDQVAEVEPPTPLGPGRIMRGPVNARRYITLANGRSVALGDYVAGVRKAIEAPGATFKHGLSTWYSVTGAEIRRQFLASVHDRINSQIPTSLRGVA